MLIGKNAFMTTPSGPTIPQGPVVDAVYFDGTNDYMKRTTNWTGLSDGRYSTLSVWVKPAAIADGSRIDLFMLDGAKFYVNRGTGGNLVFTVKGASSSSAIYNRVSNTTVNSGSGWSHILWSFDSLNLVDHLYINDVADTSTENGYWAYENADWTSTWNMFANVTSNKWTGDVAQFWWTDEYVDFSVESNRRKFISEYGKPVSLGTNGETPTGTTPVAFFDGDSSTFQNNKGSGGNPILYGSLTNSTTKPSDV